jgi:Trypsin
MATHKYHRHHHPLVLLFLPNQCETGRCSWRWRWLVGATVVATAALLAMYAVGKTPSTSVVTFIDHPNRLSEGSPRRRLPQEQQNRIVGGKPVAAADKLPAFAFSAGTKLCGATVIHPDVLLSAAHCEGAFRKDGVLIGGVSISGLDTDEFVGVVLEKLHPKYQPSSEQNDIMLVKLDRPIGAPLVKYNVNASRSIG